MTTTALKEISWTPFQQAIFDFVENGEGSAVVEAVAGSGKTTTIVEAARRLPFGTEGAFVAFNRVIADELKRRLPASVPAMTLNALGNRAWKAFIGKYPEVDGYKISALVRDMTSNNDRDFVGDVKKLIDLAKGIGLVPGNLVRTSWGEARGLVPDSDQTWQDLMDEHDISFKFPGQEKDALSLARRVLLESIRVSRDKIDFNDQLYLPVVFRAPFKKYDLLFVDEAQDVNAIQLEMIERSLHKQGRLIAVGDPHQAIYGFLGAGTDSLEIIREKFNAAMMPLHVSFRCPRKVVQKARTYVSHIQHKDDAPEGDVKVWGSAWSSDDFQPTDVILCRNNAPLISMAFKLIRDGVGVKVLGRDIGRGLIALVNKLKATDTNDLRRKLLDHLDKESKKLRDKPDQIARLEDRVATLMIFINAQDNLSSVQNVIASIEKLFSTDDANENKQLLTLSTVHKAKGGEWPRVFILNPGLMPAGWVEPGTWQYDQEIHLQYVAVTRAQKELIYIEME